MRFGRDFQQLQIPKWAGAYLNYDSLKQFQKRLASDDQDVLDCKTNVRRLDWAC
jgi:SPX domain protein involved in polyphosphate accumulation